MRISRGVGLPVAFAFFYLGTPFIVGDKDTPSVPERSEDILVEILPDPESESLALACRYVSDIDRVFDWVNRTDYHQVHNDWNRLEVGCFAFNLDESDENYTFLGDVGSTLAYSIRLDGYDVEVPRIFAVEYSCSAKLYVSYDFVFDDHLIDPDTGVMSILLANDSTVCQLEAFYKE